MINLEELAKFLVKAKKATYAGNGRELHPGLTERFGFKELEFHDGCYYYRDSYTGFFMAPGQEVVRIGGPEGKPVWAMSYSGGMTPDFRDDMDFAKETFLFLKRALSQVSEDAPYRGPDTFGDGEGRYYQNSYHGDITNFRGSEKIVHTEGKVKGIVFAQDYIGGLVIPKNS